MNFFHLGINHLENHLEYWIKEITIIKENDTSKVNYVDKTLWDFKPTSDVHANSYLTVNPEDFEDE
jgi:hypothetical protein